MHMLFADHLRRATLLVGAVACVSIAGCSITEAINSGSTIDYKSAGKLPSLDVPPDLVAPKGDGRYAIPERQQRTYSGYQTSRSAERAATDPRVLPQIKGMKIERAGAERWLVVNQSADKLWPVIREFWQELGFLIQKESPGTGIMETDWAENRAKLSQDILRRSIGKLFDSLYSTGERDRFRTRLESVAGGTEIYISHRGMIEVAVSSSGLEKDQTRWQSRPSDPELEVEFLRRLMVKLGADDAQARRLVASETARPQLARIVGSDPADGGLEISEGFDRAWRRIGLALDRGGFTVEDRDRSKGIYFVRYIDPEVTSKQKKGFFANLFGSKQDTSAQQYQVRVEAKEQISWVTVRSKEGDVLKADADLQSGRKILALLQDQLKQ
jgi:outer membrane protein assembly factor BamC